MDNQRENRNYASRNPIGDLQRLGDIERWQIVRTTKSQTVAEHSFMVILLCYQIGEALGVGVNTDTLVTAATVHDAEEAWTGDMPSPVKQFIDRAAIPKHKMLGDMAWMCYEENENIQTLVKIADLACDVKFLQRYGEGDHAAQVQREIHERLRNTVDRWKAEQTTATFPLDVVLSEFFECEETHLDDYVRKEV